MVKSSKSEVQRLKTTLRWKLPTVQRERIQMVLLRESGLTQPAIAAAMGVSLSTVNRAHMAYDQGGIKALKPKPNGYLPQTREYDLGQGKGPARPFCQKGWCRRDVEHQ